jgi:hypothetical protein
MSQGFHLELKPSEALKVIPKLKELLQSRI